MGYVQVLESKIKLAINKIDADIKTFFDGRQSSLKLFNSLRKTIEKCCSPKIEVSKTQISFGEKYKYLWVWLPQTWIKKRTQNSITMTVMTGKKIRSHKIEESVQPKKGYWTHHIIIETSKDIDDEIVELIKESYNFYLKRLEHEQPKKKTTST